MSKERFHGLTVERTAAGRAATGHTQSNIHRHAGAKIMSASIIACLVECEGAKISKLHFDNGVHPTECRTDAHPEDSILADGRVHDASRISLRQPLRRLERTPEGAGNIFAVEENAFIFCQQILHRAVDGVYVGHIHAFCGSQLVALQSIIRGSGGASLCA